MNADANCGQWKPSLLELMLEEIAPADRRQVERHLESCEACSRELAEMRRTLSVVAHAKDWEELPRRIRIAAEPQRDWLAIWRNPARLAFASAGLLCLAITLLSLFHTAISYDRGNFQIAFGAAGPAALVAGGASSPSAAGAIAPAGAHQLLDRAQAYEMISQAMAAAEADRRQQSNQMTKEVSERMEQRWQHDLSDMAASLHYFQAAETMLYKGQVQNQQLVSALMRQSGGPAPQQ